MTILTDRRVLSKTVLAAVFCLAVDAVAAEYAWSGGGDGTSWNSADNWGGAGVPGKGDYVTIAGGSGTSIVIPDEGVTVARVTSLSGTVTFSGGMLSVDDTTTQQRFVCKKDGATVLTFNNVLDCGSSVFRMQLNGATVNYNAGINARSWWAPDTGGGTVNVRNVPCNIATVSAGSATYNFYVPITNAAGNCRAEFINSATVHFYTNVFDTTAFFGDNRKEDNFHLHGFDQKFGDLHVWHGSIDTDAGKPATISFKQATTTWPVTTNTTGNWSGPLSFHMLSGSVNEFRLNRSVDSSGSLTVSGGTFTFTENAAWPNIASLRVNGGKVNLAAGKVLTVPALYLGDGEESVADGSYGATAAADHVDTEHFDGEGIVLVKAVEPATVTATWTGGGATDTALGTAANWKDAATAPDMSSGALLATFATAGASATVDGSRAFKGIVLDAPDDFTIAGSAPARLAIGSLGIAALGAHTYALDAPTYLTYEQPWNIGEGATLDVTGSVSSRYATCDILKTGKGKVNLKGTSTFTGSLAITNGQVNVYSSVNAFGAASGESRVALYETTACDGGVSLRFMPDSASTNEKPLYVYSNGKYASADLNLYFDNGSYTVFNGPFLMSGYLRTQAAKNTEIVFRGGFRPAGDGMGAFLGFSCTDTASGTRPLIRFADVPASSGTELSFTHVGASFDVAGSDFKRLELLGWTYFDTTVDYAWDGDGNFNFDGYGCVDLHGHDQRVGRILLSASKLNGQANSGSLKSTGGPATLYFNQSTQLGNKPNQYDSTNSTTIIEGCLSLSKRGTYAFIQNCAATSYGDIEVTEGSFVFTENASWVNGSNAVVRGTGRLVLATATNFNKKVVVTLADTGVLELNDASRDMWCSQLLLDDGNGGLKAAKPGTWGAAGSGAQHVSDRFAGTGRLRVPSAGTVLMFR